jgi:hypothetical protein
VQTLHVSLVENTELKEKTASVRQATMESQSEYRQPKKSLKRHKEIKVEELLSKESKLLYPHLINGCKKNKRRYGKGRNATA